MGLLNYLSYKELEGWLLRGGLNKSIME